MQTLLGRHEHTNTNNLLSLPALKYLKVVQIKLLFSLFSYLLVDRHLTRITCGLVFLKTEQAFVVHANRSDQTPQRIRADETTNAIEPVKLLDKFAS